MGIQVRRTKGMTAQSELISGLGLIREPKFAAVVSHYARACRASRLHGSEAARALANYGSHGAQISGCVRDHFPAGIKNRLRNLARLVGDEMDLAHKARPKFIKQSTIIRIGRTIATRDGIGFYGPAPYPYQETGIRYR